jgi:NitT/TauT family transport system ATP-binding protein
MRQRVAFLRTLLAEKEILLLDEPFGALDSITRGEMHEWLLSVLDDTPRTLILVTHDVEEAVFLCDRVLVFSKRPGRIVLDMDVRTERHESRRETISAPDFVALKDRALEALQ